MTRLRTLLFAVLATSAVLYTLRFPALALGQQLGEGMDRSGVLDIENDAEKTVFMALQCICGCPRESIGTCTCSFAHDFRAEVRGMIARGMSLEEIKDEWVRKHGTGALMVPRNEGANRFLYLLPLAIIVGMAAIAVRALRSYRRNDLAPAPAAPTKKSETDEYDDKLDEELKRLDDE